MSARNSCPVCDNHDIDQLPDNLSYCISCDHYFQSDLNVTIAYDSKYMETYDRYPTEYMALARAGYALREIAHTSRTEGPVNPSHIPVLDFGYGNGAFLKEMKKLGYPIYGLDVHGVDYGVTDWKRGLHPRPVIVTAFDSLEHVPEFDGFFGLNADIYLISTPYRPAWFGRDARQWRHFKPGEHLHYFSLSSLSRLFGDRGYEMVAWGFPEDVLRGKITHEGDGFDNIVTASFHRKKR